MIDFVSQVGAFIGTSFLLFVATRPKKSNDDATESPPDSPPINLSGARKYSREGRKQYSFGMHDDFDM